MFLSNIGSPPVIRNVCNVGYICGNHSQNANRYGLSGLLLGIISCCFIQVMSLCHRSAKINAPFFSISCIHAVLKWGLQVDQIFSLPPGDTVKMAEAITLIGDAERHLAAADGVCALRVNGAETIGRALEDAEDLALGLVLDRELGHGGGKAGRAVGEGRMVGAVRFELTTSTSRT